MNDPDEDAIDLAHDRTALAEERDDLAHDRTDMAEDRTLLANERTFAGWFRTGLGAVGIGLGFQALFVRMEPAWVPRAIATAFLLIGIFLFISAERRACTVLARLNAHRAVPIRINSLRLITYGTCLAAVALIAAMWMLRIDR